MALDAYMVRFWYNGIHRSHLFGGTKKALDEGLSNFFMRIVNIQAESNR